MVTYCEVARGGAVFAVLDCPLGMTASDIVTYVDTTASLANLSEHGAIYWPQVKVVNPNRDVFGGDDTITVPPSGHIAGMFARTDGGRVGGVYDPPAGVDKGKLFGVVGFETDEVLEEERRDIVYPKRINPITRLRGQPIAVDGVRTLSANGNFPTIAERRGASFIEQSLKDGLQFARLRNNDESLRAEVARTCTTFLTSQMKVGAFRSKDPATAFFVDVSDAINPPSEQFAGKLNVRIGIATQKPAEFLVLSFSQDTRALDEELASQSQ
jgi:phage tail sheath protein FI